MRTHNEVIIEIAETFGFDVVWLVTGIIPPGFRCDCCGLRTNSFTVLPDLVDA